VNSILRFSQRLSADHLVLDLCEDECGHCDGADRGRVGGDVAEGAPTFLEKGEATFSLVAQAAEQDVPSDRVGIELAFPGFFAGTGTPGGAGPACRGTRQG